MHNSSNGKHTCLYGIVFFSSAPLRKVNSTGTTEKMIDKPDDSCILVV